MKRLKIHKYISILFVSLFIFIPSTKADYTTDTYNHYYFFIEAYSPSDIKDDEYITAFPGIELGGYYSSDKTIPITRSCTNPNDESCWSYNKFYEKYLEAEKKGTPVPYKVEGNDNISKRYNKDGNTYYIHGSYKKEGTNKWITDNKTLAEKYNYYDSNNIISCATFGIEDGDANLIDDSKIYEYAIMKVGRDLFDNYSISDEILNPWSDFSNCNNNKSIYPLKSNTGEKTVFSPVLYKYVYKQDNYVCKANPNKDGTCNASTTLTSDCSGNNRVTINTGNARANVEINQTGTITNILTPKTIYQGGGVKFGFVYHNEIRWDYAERTGTDDIEYRNITETQAKQQITNNLRDRLKDDFLNKINPIVKINGELVTMHKDCKQTGSFEEGKTLTTVCTFYLPNAIIDKNGQVSYSTSEGINYGINNKHYTPLNYKGDYKFEVEIGNLSVIKNGDGINIGDWTLKFGDHKDDNCSVNVYSQITKPNIKFIYRPIDLTNPFPNRNAGINWFGWYSKDNNKDELANPYDDDPEYTFILDNETLSNIKKYNNDKDEDGEGYFNWDDIDAAGKSEFIDDYGERIGDAS